MLGRAQLPGNEQLQIIVKEELEKQGMTQRQLAEKAGISEKTISNIMTKKQNLQFDTAEELLSALGCCLIIKSEKNNKTRGIELRQDVFFKNDQGELIHIFKPDLLDIIKFTHININNHIEVIPDEFAEFLLGKDECLVPRVRLDFWHYLLSSGFLDNDPESLDIYYENKGNNKKIEAAKEYLFNCLKCIGGVQFESVETEDIFNAVIGWKAYNVTPTLRAYLEKNKIHIEFNDKLKGKIKKAVEKWIENEKEKVYRAREFINDNDRGLEFWIVDDMHADTSDLEEFLGKINVVYAWSEKVARKKYLNNPEFQYAYYKETFVSDFGRSIFYGDIYDFMKEVKANKEIKKIVKTLETKIRNDSEDEFVDMLKRSITPEALFNIFGRKNFDEFYYWNCIDIPHCIIKPDQRDIVEYVLSERIIETL